MTLTLSRELYESPRPSTFSTWPTLIVNIPRPIEQVGDSPEKGFAVATLEADGVQALDGEELAGLVAALPDNYSFNNNLTGATGLHAQGKLGQNVIVAVIDTGTANDEGGAGHEGRLVAGRGKPGGWPRLAVCPPYIIFGDATLQELARRRPTSLAQMRGHLVLG